MTEHRTEPMEIQVIEEGVILPRKMANGAPMWGLGGVCDAGGTFVEASFYDGGWAKHGGAYPVDTVQTLDAPALYIGMFYRHWGHFLIDLTNRLWAVRQLRARIPDLKIAYLGEETVTGNNLEFFRLLGVAEEDLYQVSVPTRFSKVYVPQQAFQSCAWYTDEHLALFDTVVEGALQSEQDFSALQDIRKVYFTRTGFGKAQGSEFGEAYFERVFEKNGFTPIAPERLTLSEQIYLWNHAEEIACVNGSIPLNVLFCRNQNLKLTVLNKTALVHENPYILLEMRQVEAVFLNVYDEPFRRYPKSLGEGPYLLVPTEEFRAYCRKTGWVSPFTPEEEAAQIKQTRRRYYRYVFSIKRRLRSLAIKIVYGLKLR